MNQTDWHKIKEQVYYWDGSWRDIYVLGTTQDDWSKWIDLINGKYSVAFYNGQTEQSETFINKNVVFDYFNGKTDLLNNATITLGNIMVKCYFFTDQEIENDIDPREVDTIEDHHRLMSYLIDISKALNKTVVLTAENEQETIYISVDGDNVTLNDV
jgi:hypothetical protein